MRGRSTSGFWALTLGSIGVVFGDIGTSPLYAFREAVTHAAEGSRYRAPSCSACSR
jgi:KUP system potassium uptake protein